MGYPEGTRGSGAPARFHSGAFRLAAAAGVPVVPVGLRGTSALLPKNGRIRRNRVTVTIGVPMHPDADAARAEVSRLAGASWPPAAPEPAARPARPPPGPAATPFLASAVTHRGTRIATVGALCSLAGLGLRRRPERYPVVLLAVTGAFAVGLTAVVLSWS